MPQDPSILNPLANPIFFPVLYRFMLVFLLGLLLLFVLKKFRLKGIWKSKFGKIYTSWLLLGLIYLFAVLIGGYVALLLLLLATILIIWETAMISKIPKSYICLLILLAAISTYTVSFHTDNFFMLPILYFISIGTLAITRNNKKELINFLIVFFISLWVIFFLNHFVLLGHQNNTIDTSKSLLLLIGFSISLSDIFAYIVGKSFSRTKLNNYRIASNISPNKTYIGVLGNILGAALGIFIMYFAVKTYFSLIELIVLSFVIGIFGAIGDLTESVFKRYFNTKESGDLIPGHGGIFDRVDSVLPVIVAVYYYVLFFT